MIRVTFERVAARVPAPVKGRVARVVRSPALRRRLKPVRWGTLHTNTPVSTHYGADRGTPVDRVYIGRFFEGHAADVHGRVLEVGAPVYTRRAGRGVTGVDVVDIDPGNFEATIVADLAVRGSLPVERFDCVLLPQTLQYVDDVEAAVANCYDALVPGGVLLVTVPAVAKLDHDLAHVERWRFLPRGFERMIMRACPAANVATGAYGNLVATIAFLHGIAAEELRAGEIDVHDALYPLVTWARAEKPGA